MRHLRRAGLLRTWGGVAGAVLPTLIEYATSGRVVVLGFGTDGDSAPLGFGTIFVGYLLGALAAEVSFARPVPHGRRAASLAPRRLTDYLPRRVVLPNARSRRSGRSACSPWRRRRIATRFRRRPPRRWRSRR